MRWLKSLLMILFAASQVFVAALFLAVCSHGYDDDAYSMAVIATLVGAIFGAPAVLLKQAGMPLWMWSGVQVLLSLFAIGLAALLHNSPEGGSLSAPMLAVAFVAVPVLYLAAELARHKAALLGGLTLAGIAVLAAIPIAQL